MAAYQARIDRGCTVARYRRDPEKGALPHFVAYTVGRKSRCPSGRVLWVSLVVSYFFVPRSDGIFASPTGVVHPVHFLTRTDVELYKGG